VSTWFIFTPQAAGKLAAMDFGNLAVKETAIDYAPLENNAEFLIYEGSNAVGKGRVLGRTIPYQVKQQRK
jgi:hypothetical protein